MTPRRGWIVCLFVCIGCQSALLSQKEHADPQTLAVAENGQPAPEHSPPSQSSILQAGYRPLGYFEPSLGLHPAGTQSHLSQALALIEKGEDFAACEELGRYLAAHPEHLDARIQRADLLLRLNKLSEARKEFILTIAQAQERGDKTRTQQLHCHQLLMDIADTEEDEYGLHFHRGVGLYLLALERAKLPNLDQVLPVEGLLSRAATELALARMQRPQEAQPCWYLHQVWSALGQQVAAKRWLERATSAAPFAELTPAEQREMWLEARAFEKNSPRK